MSADPWGSESSSTRPWYLEMSGRRAGPFAWTVIVELAQAGALGSDDRLWSMGLASWSRAADLPDLAPLIREAAATEDALAAPGAPDATTGAEASTDPEPRREPPLILAAGIAWIALTIALF